MVKHLLALKVELKGITPEQEYTNCSCIMMGRHKGQGKNIHEGTRVKRLDTLIHENSKKCHFHENVYKYRYK